MPNPGFNRTTGHAAIPAGEPPIPTAQTNDQIGQALPTPRRRYRVVLGDPQSSANNLRPRIEIERQTSWGELLIKDLIREQRRLSFSLAMLMVVFLASLPLIFAVWPWFAGLTVIGIPIAWLLLAVFPFPAFLVIALWHYYRAERYEQDFVDMIEG